MSRPARRLSRCGGIALIAVLWLLSILAVLATAAAALSVSHRRASEQLGESVTLDALADSGIRVAMLRVIHPNFSTQFLPAGGAFDVSFARGSVHVTLEREAGRIDLNTADEELLFALFVNEGWGELDAHAMVAKIADWKDADDEPRGQGAERAQYLLSGLPYAPRNSEFETVEELRQVLGTVEIATQLYEALTVYSHSRTASAAAATQSVRGALELADRRQLGGHRWLPTQEVAAVSRRRSQPRSATAHCSERWCAFMRARSGEGERDAESALRASHRARLIRCRSICGRALTYRSKVSRLIRRVARTGSITDSMMCAEPRRKKDAPLTIALECRIPSVTGSRSSAGCGLADSSSREPVWERLWQT